MLPFVFKGTDLDPELISGVIDRQPTLSYRRGDTYEINGRVERRKFGLWLFSTRNRVHSPSLKRHLEELEIIILGSHSPWPDRTLGKIQELLKKHPIEFRVDVFWYGAEGEKLPTISKSFNYVIDEAGGTVETDFHTDGEQTEAA